MYRIVEPPTPIDQHAKFVNSFIVKHALTDDTSIGLYYMDDPEAQVRIFYRTLYPDRITLINTKVLFLYFVIFFYVQEKMLTFVKYR